MAKSLRSKWKRKMKAIKRERYGDKELKRLNDMIDKSNKKGVQSVPKFGQQINSEDMEMKDKTNGTEIESMDTNSGVKRNPKTMRDQFGHYPEWMNGRQVKKLKNKLKIKRLKSKKK